ncbi:unnamed protein product [Rhizopus stolonifer]
MLCQSSDPSEVIKTIQNEYGLDLVGIENVYPFLDFLGCSRFETHETCLGALNSEVVKRIEILHFNLKIFTTFSKKRFHIFTYP